MKKWLATVAIAATTMSPVIAGVGQPVEAASPVTVTMWARAATSQITEALVKKFNATHGDVRIALTVLPLNTEDPKFAAAVRSGTVPDLFGMNDVSMAEFDSEGALRPMTSFLKSLPYYNQLNPGQMKLAEYNGQEYGVPDMQDLSVLWYNKSLFKKAGLNPNDPPTNFAQIISDSEKITALGHGIKGFSFGGDCGGCEAFTLEPMISATGDNLLKGPIGHQAVNVAHNKALVALISMLHTLWAKGLVPAADRTENGSTFGDDFLAGTVGIEPNGLGTIYGPYLANAKKNPKDAFGLGIAMIPGPTGGFSTFTGGDEFVLPKGGKHVQQAEEFIKWVLEPSQQVMYPSNGYTPVRDDVLTSAYTKKFPYDAVALKAATHGYAPKAVPWQALFSNTGPWGPMLNGAVFSGKTSSYLATGQSQMESILKSSNP